MSDIVNENTGVFSGYNINPANPSRVLSCNKCIHQKVCTIFALFKGTIEPRAIDPETQKPIVNGEQLAYICQEYADSHSTYTIEEDND